MCPLRNLPWSQRLAGYRRAFADSLPDGRQSGRIVLAAYLLQFGLANLVGLVTSSVLIDSGGWWYSDVVPSGVLLGGCLINMMAIFAFLRDVWRRAKVGADLLTRRAGHLRLF